MTILNRSNFPDAISQGNRPVLVVFLSSWCFYCRRILPILERIARQYGDALMVGQVDIDKECLLGREERIEVLPTLVLYHKGTAQGSLVAPQTGAEIQELIRKYSQKM